MSWLSDLWKAILNALDPQPLPVPKPPKPPFPPGPSPSLSVAALIAALNAERAKVGEPPFIESPKLDAVSQSWAEYNASTGVLDHGNWLSRILAVFPGNPAGEDIAEGQTSIAQVVQDWMNSPGHRAQILGDYNTVGAGIAKSKAGKIFFCVDFVKQ